MASLPPPTGAASELDDADALEVLARGELEVRGRIVDASNATLLAEVRLEGVEALCVYKPTAGERPLWDFPGRTLAKRVLASGRPPCQLCGQPLDPRGHLCPRHNGYHR